MSIADEIKASGLFDKEWYLATYRDVALSKIEPISHFVRIGMKIGRNPSPKFDTKHYLSQVTANELAGMSPILHYLRIGRDKGLLPCPPQSPRELGLPRHTHQVGKPSDFRPIEAARRQAEIFPGLAIAIPVYNAADEVIRCLDSVVQHTPEDVRIVVIDDKSPDQRIREILEDYGRRFKNIEAYYNSKNRGFTGTINRAIELAAPCDVIFLNSDTEVSAGWTQRLRIAAYSAPKIATVTPVSNNAGAFSVPQTGENEVPEMGLAAFSRSLARQSQRIYLEAPTGNGFCLYVRRACIDEIGQLDVKAFPRGYGEENDFCMRAGRAGWTHIIDDATYVFHVRTASFGASKTELISAGRAEVDRRYPEYTGLVRAFVKSQELAENQRQAERAIAGYDPVLDAAGPRLLYVLPKLGAKGGTPQTNRDLMQQASAFCQPFLLQSDGSTLKLFFFHNGENVLLEEHHLSENIRFSPHLSDEYDAVVLDWCLRYGIDLLHYRHLAFHSTSIIGHLKATGFPVVFSLHDFYMLCPTVKLLDNERKYCAGNCTNSDGDCSYDLWKHDGLPPLKHHAIYDWRGQTAEVLSRCDTLVTTSIYARDLVQSILPTVKRKDFRVIPHGRDFQRMRAPTAKWDGKGPLRILVPGGINHAKGGAVLKALSEHFDKSVEFHLLGNISNALLPMRNLVNHGPYDRDNFVSRVEDACPDIHLGAIFSIWPETYCHTLTELWAAGLPVLGVELGAVGERIQETGAGWLISPQQVIKSAAELIERILVEPEEIRHRSQFVETWQATIGIEHNTEWMAGEYKGIYSDWLPALRTR